MAQDNVTILRVQLDEGQTEKQLQELVLKIEATKKAQADLNAQRKIGAVDDAAYAKQVVDLKTQLAGQQAEQRGLTKNLDLYRTAVSDTTGTYQGLQAQLSLAQNQFKLLDGSADNSTESAKALGKTIDELRNTLKATDETQSLFVRNVGNYPKGESLAPLVQQLVKLEEAMKAGAITAEQTAAADAALIGYKQRIAQAGAIEGKSYEETTALVKSYGDAIRPATAELIKLEAEQKQVAESGKATGEQVAQIGFRFGAAQKSIKDATDALKEVPAAAEDGAKETKSLGAGLLDAAKSSDVLGGAVDVLTTAKEKYATAAELAKVATASEVGVLGLLKLALIATGLGLFVVVLGSVVAFLTKTQAGTDFLSRKMAALGAVVRVITNLFVDLGGKIVAAAENPKQAFADLVEFIETNLGNRLKAFGVLLDAVRNRDFSKLVDGTVQLTTGITEATARAKAFGQEVAAAADSAERLAQMERELQRAEDDNIATNKTLLNQVERLKNVRDNEFNTIKQRQAANEQAYKIEMQREATLTELASRRVELLRAQIAQEGGRDRVSRERYQELKNAENELADIREDAAGKQNELITNRYQLEQEAIDKSIERRAQAFALEAALLNKRLAQAQVNSNEELNIQQRLLNNQRAAELNVKNLTVTQKRAIDAKYEQASLALSLDFNKRRMLAALQAQADLTAAELAGQQAGSVQVLQLQTQQIEEQRRLAIAALNANADNTAAVAKINAQAAQQRQAAEYADATRLLTQYLDNKRAILEKDYAKGAIQEGEYQRRLAVLNKAGTDAQAEINKDYRQDNTENQKQATQNEIDEARRARDVIKQTEEAKQQIRGATVQAFDQAADSVIAAFGAESAAGQVALTVKKLAAIAEIEIGVEKQFAANAETGAKISALAPPVTTPIGIAYTITQDALAVAAAAASVANILKFQQGGIAYGPSHADGGIRLYRNGQPTGIEIEGGEPVLTRGVSQNPLLLSLASTVNQLAGGRALTTRFPTPHMALGGVSQPLILDQLRGAAGDGINYERLSEATAKALRKSPPITRISDVQAGLGRAAETQQLSNS